MVDWSTERMSANCVGVVVSSPFSDIKINAQAGDRATRLNCWVQRLVSILVKRTLAKYKESVKLISVMSNAPLGSCYCCLVYCQQGVDDAYVQY